MKGCINKLDFTINKYKELLDTINKNNIPVYTVKNWIEKQPNRGILLRHDVDRIPGNARKMAIIENKYNIYSTYYFRTFSFSFNKKIIKKISNLGHEIGYHYEDYALAKGNIKKSKRLFKQHLQRFRELADIKTIAMHGRPLSKYDSRNMWQSLSLKDFNISAEVFLSLDYSDLYYFTDTGRSWSLNSANIRDKVYSKKENNVKTTDQLIKYIPVNKKSKIGIVAHPERWNENYLMWFVYFIFDKIVNITKFFIEKIYK